MTFSTQYDSWLFDLDGTVWEGSVLLPHAAEIINNADVPVRYITNNASRHPRDVATKLSEIGVATTGEQVLTSAQAAVELAQNYARPGDALLVVGSDSFKQLAEEAGFRVVSSADDQPLVVLQGHSPDNGWAQLSEAALSIARGAKYIASNLDSTLPSERGLLVGNGSMVAAVVSATGVQPEVAGKPEGTMFLSAAVQCSSQSPLAIGDRLNTDIAGGVAAGFDSFHVLTGVSRQWALLHADASERPTFVAQDLSGLLGNPDDYRPHACGEFEAHMEDGNVILTGGSAQSTALQALHTVLEVAWKTPQFGGKLLTQSPHAERVIGEWK